MTLTETVDDGLGAMADRKLIAYLEGRIGADRLKADLYVDNALHRARRLVHDDAKRLRQVDPDRFAQLRRMLAVDDPRGAQAFLSP